MIGLLFAFIVPMIVGAIIVAHLTESLLKEKVKGQFVDATRATINEILKGPTTELYLEVTTSNGVRQVTIQADSVDSGIKSGKTYYLS